MVISKYFYEVGTVPNGDRGELLENRDYVDSVLKEGAGKARDIASATIKRLRKAIGID